MKKHLLISMFMLGAISLTTSAQDTITNHSFEYWNPEPVGWFIVYPLSDTINVEPSTDAQEGELSIKLSIKDDNPTIYKSNAEFNSDVLSLTQRPGALQLYYKGTMLGTDQLTIIVALFESGTPIGGGTYITNESADSWTLFTMPISYTNNNIPNMGIIQVSLGDAEGISTVGSEIYVDNLAWTAQAAVDDISASPSITLAPNPASKATTLQFSLPQTDRLTFTIRDLKGSTRYQSENSTYTAGENFRRFDVSALSAGIYILQATGEHYRFTKKLIITGNR